MKEFLQKFYSFSKSEQRSILFLLTILVVVIFIRFNLHLFIKDKAIYKNKVEHVTRIFDSIQLALKNKKNEVEYYKSEKKKNWISSSNNDKLFFFNPNYLSKEGWMKLGLSEKQANAVIKYTSGKIVFKKKEDLKKVFVISDKFYSKVEPYIQLEKNSDENTNNNNEAKQVSNEIVINEEKIKSKLILELNSTDTSGLKALKGIGTYFAKKIIYYREKLGGFYSINQLAEIENLDFQIVKENNEYILIDTSLIKKININKIPAYNLSKHPYFSKNVANALVNYRDNHGKFKSVNDLKKCILIDDALFKKISPYISIE